MSLLLRISLVCALALGFTACARQVPLQTPTFQAATSNEAITAKAIRAAFLKRGWAITRTQPGRMEATYRRGNGPSATVAVSYSGRNVTISYVDSSDLLYGVDSRGQKVIHKTYITWVTNLKNDIQIEIGATL